MNFIRNFAIIAHVDHGKSTLADRFLELTGVVERGKHEEQLLDRNPISRERGITIKLAPVRMQYKYKVSSIKYKEEEPEKYLILNTKYFILTYNITLNYVKHNPLRNQAKSNK